MVSQINVWCAIIGEMSILNAQEVSELINKSVQTVKRHSKCKKNPLPSTRCTKTKKILFEKSVVLKFYNIDTKVDISKDKSDIPVDIPVDIPSDKSNKQNGVIEFYVNAYNDIKNERDEFKKKFENSNFELGASKGRVESLKEQNNEYRKQNETLQRITSAPKKEAREDESVGKLWPKETKYLVLVIMVVVVVVLLLVLAQNAPVVRDFLAKPVN